MASYTQRLPGLAEDGFYEEELERIRNRKQDVGLTYEPTPVDGETFPELPDDGQNWRYDEYNQPTLNPGVGDESYRNIHIDYAPGTKVTPERYRQDQKAAEDRFFDIFGSPRDGGTSGDDYRQLPSPPPKTGRAGYGSRIGADPDSMFTMDWVDKDGDGTDDRHQRGPGQPHITWEDSTPEERGKFGRKPGRRDTVIGPPPGGWNEDDQKLPEEDAGGWDDEWKGRRRGEGGGRRPPRRREKDTWGWGDAMPPGWGGSGTPPREGESMEDYQRRMREIQDRWDNQRREEREGRRPPRRRGKDTWGPGEEMPRPVKPGLPRPPESGPRPSDPWPDGDGRPYPMPGPRPEVPPIHGDPGPRPPRRIDDGDGFPGFDPGWLPGWPGKEGPGISEEQQLDNQVEDLYNEILGRKSDAEGKEYWKSMVRDGMSMDEVVTSFKQSPEAQDRKTRKDPDDMVELYQDVEPIVRYNEGYTPTPDEHQQNIDKLKKDDNWRAPLERYGVKRKAKEAELISQTPDVGQAPKQEAKNRAEQAARDQQKRAERRSISRPVPTVSKPSTSSTSDFLDSVYQNELGRSADSGGKDYWSKQIESGAQTRDDVIANIRRSQEFKNK